MAKVNAQHEWAGGRSMGAALAIANHVKFDLIKLANNKLANDDGSVRHCEPAFIGAIDHNNNHAKILPVNSDESHSPISSRRRRRRMPYTILFFVSYANLNVIKEYFFSKKGKDSLRAAFNAQLK